MPWSADDAKRHTKSADTPEKCAKWAATANAVLKETGDEGKAIRIANSKMMGGGGMPKPGLRNITHAP